MTERTDAPGNGCGYALMVAVGVALIAGLLLGWIMRGAIDADLPDPAANPETSEASRGKL